MHLENLTRRALWSWLSLSLLVLLVCVLGALQYHWIGDISELEQKKLQENLQSSLHEVSRDFNSELNTASGSLLPPDAYVQAMGRERAYERRYSQWKNSSGNVGLLKRIAVVWGVEGQLTLRMLDRDRGVLVPAEWPAGWSHMRDRITALLRRGTGREWAPPGPGQPSEDGELIDLPRFGASRPQGPPGPPPREQDWLLVEVDRAYVARVILPELLERHFGSDYRSNYHVRLYAKSRPEAVIYQTESDNLRAGDPADASVSLFDVAPQSMGRRGPGQDGPRAFGPMPGGPGGPGQGLAPPNDPGAGRWQLAVRLQAGSLESVVARARERNLAVSAGILLLMLATAGALVRFSRQAQRLAELEMEFVAGVSHELRTPLTVIRTAAFNLRGKLAGNPSQVESYGALIQRESEKLTAIVEQVLRFASAKSGLVIREWEPVSLAGIVEDSLQASRGILEDHRCHIEKQIEPALPLVLGDSVALRHALQNLIGNAVKYGMEGGDWIGVSARSVSGPQGDAVELRVSDHGPGIPLEERPHIFDAFFRGKQAVHAQIHGTGLGLNLVKKIVQAHGGTVNVESEPGTGTSFILRIPAKPVEHRDEFAHSLS